MASLHPHEQQPHSSRHSTHSGSPEAEKMLKNPNGAPGPEAGAIPDGLEVNEGAHFNTAPQAYQPDAYQPEVQQYKAYYDHNPQTPQTQYTQTTYTNNHQPPVAVPPVQHESKGDRRVCGLRKPTFLLTLVCLALLAAVIAIAGAMGAVLAQKNSEVADLSASVSALASATASPTPTTTSVAALDMSKPAPTDTAIRKGECPTTSTKPQWEIPGTNLTFVKDCGKDYIYKDITKIPTRNIEECIRFCAVYNLNQQTDLWRCAGIVYLYRDDDGGNNPFCWLKYAQNTDQILSKNYAESAWIV
ncbi:uncharacterized protein CTRU02_202770 [Colletotrichum truncatum]|uniref:Uncharacterized protein n=1 Tax=Colletotrichum truncatum TaxID=5467 RepID=A0ACC3ZLN1_COLTU|nr:uncharacterized protein CTRU02_10694 [Colletotrichum truncatum]KAF6786996.1 hypothetical protein CTRU02_10694 [Colletotrichum truncatum]